MLQFVLVFSLMLKTTLHLQQHFRPSHLPVAVVAGVGSQDAADLHVGELLLQDFHHIPDTQVATDGHTVKHL